MGRDFAKKLFLHSINSLAVNILWFINKALVSHDFNLDKVKDIIKI